MTLIWIPPGRLPVGVGGDGKPPDPHPFGVGGVGVPNSLWDQARSSSFSLLSHPLRPECDHNELPERTQPDRRTIIRLTNKGDSAEANGK